MPERLLCLLPVRCTVPSRAASGTRDWGRGGSFLAAEL